MPARDERGGWRRAHRRRLRALRGSPAQTSPGAAHPQRRRCRAACCSPMPASAPVGSCRHCRARRARAGRRTAARPCGLAAVTRKAVRREASVCTAATTRPPRASPRKRTAGSGCVRGAPRQATLGTADELSRTEACTCGRRVRPAPYRRGSCSSSRTRSPAAPHLERCKPGDTACGVMAHPRAPHTPQQRVTGTHMPPARAQAGSLRQGCFTCLPRTRWAEGSRISTYNVQPT